MPFVLHLSTPSTAKKDGSSKVVAPLSFGRMDLEKNVDIADDLKINMLVVLLCLEIILELFCINEVFGLLLDYDQTNPNHHSV
jgi:hypothetical protein